ncbi:unnamed protein product [Rotaria sordida]|uniref:protein-tyrosine-phosphatase n=1 Tax=Rotaria sordida TaxID=392033 RepID=A0A814D751_9BILA|nr:unnamed protein product [Rotaria sordida]CAF0953150.1 unnamed protein product [Rotaria sordida]
MTENTDGDNICNRTAGLVVEFEQSRDPDSTEIGRQFNKLQRTMMKNKDILSCNEGIKSINRLKNRYKDILPYDKYRVILPLDNDSDYINASFIEDLYGHRRYIAAQGPIDTSLIDFFHMIWNFQITSIICTANDIEAGRMKFRRYWPDDGESLQFGSYHITKDVSNDKTYRCNDYEIYSLIITREEIQRHILLYHVLHWFDHDIPNDESSILELLSRVYQDRNSSIDSPILVHCSAGCGRTGSLIAIDLCRLLLNDEHLFFSRDYQPYPVFKIASHIRQFRIALIQTLKQYLFVHKMFACMMKIHENILLCSILNNNEDQTLDSSLTTTLSPPTTLVSSSRRQSGPFQIILRSPPIGRRLFSGSNNSSPTKSPSEFFSSPSKSSSLNDTSQISERSLMSSCFLQINTTNTHSADQLIHSNETRCNHIRSRQRESITRSDSVDIYSITSLIHHQQQQQQFSNDQGAYSD